MKEIKLYILLILPFLIFSCQDKKKYATHQEGEMTIYAEPSNQSLLEALTDMYRVNYPKVKFNIIYETENYILNGLQDTIISAAFINKPLTENQTKYIAQVSNVTPRSTLLAYDAVVFVTSEENSIDTISLDFIKEAILTGSTNIVFDDGNSGNYNTVRDVLKLELPQDRKISVAKDSDEVLDFVKKSKNTIGVIGLNIISEKENPRVKEKLENIKTLFVIDEEGKVSDPGVQNILGMNYPFVKGVYFIVREPGFGIGSGFSRFAGSQKGQLIVRREGLQPNYLWERQVKINLQNVED